MVDRCLQVSGRKHRGETRRRAARRCIPLATTAPKLIPRRGLIECKISAVGALKHRVIDIYIAQRERHRRDYIEKVEEVKNTEDASDNKRNLLELSRIAPAKDGKKEQY